MANQNSMNGKVGLRMDRFLFEDLITVKGKRFTVKGFVGKLIFNPLQKMGL